eukprot:Tbor_TRINITY_DN5332_c2_g7::TRINITY_DN5332_c2_g7_i1::g.5168::m.5168/K06997/yggS, PROSC; PLP dependent protein
MQKIPDVCSDASKPCIPPFSDDTACQLIKNYRSTLERVEFAIKKRESEYGCRLVAVSKTQPYPALQVLYENGCRVFGENYLHEIQEKAPFLSYLDLEWHFIGHLQSNKVNELLSCCPNLAVVETVDSAKLAKKLFDGVEKYRAGRPLIVYIQVNTSGEGSKSGVVPGKEAIELAQFIVQQCSPHLQFKGVMTIGMPDYTSASDFICLTKCRAEIAEACGIKSETLELSMGMSGDFESAIEMGSTNVRVGTAIFGKRIYQNKETETNVRDD